MPKHVPPSARIVVGALEELALTETYDLVFAAASLHWTEPAGRWSRIAALLEPGGVFASFGGQLRLADTGLEDAVRAARADFLPDDSVASPDGWPGTELSASSHFNDVQQSVLERPVTLTARGYVAHLSTISAYLELPSSVRQIVFDQILAVLPEQVALRGDLTLHLARRFAGPTHGRSHGRLRR